MAERYDFANLVAMVVDENEYMARVLKAVLNSMRIAQVSLCHDARQGLEDLRLAVPDVVFVDYAPTQTANGLRMVRQMRRQHHPARNCPIIVVTATPDSRTVRRARDAGADYTLAKPFSLSAVYRILVALRNEERPFVQIGSYYGPDRRRRKRDFAHVDRRGLKLDIDAATAA